MVETRVAESLSERSSAETSKASSLAAAAGVSFVGAFSLGARASKIPFDQ
jgi:hypothetical protein